MNKKHLGLSALATATGLVGCATPDMQQYVEDIDRASDYAEGAYEKSGDISKEKVQARQSNDFYIVGKKFDVTSRQTLPSFFRERFSFNRMDPVNFQELISYISKKTNVRVDLSDDAIERLEDITNDDAGDDELELRGDVPAEMQNNVSVGLSGDDNGLAGSEILFAVNFDGSLEDFLDYITGRVNLNWSWENNHIEIFHLEERTFSIDADSSEISFNASVSSSKKSSSSNGDESTVSGGSASSHETTVQSEMGSVYEDIDDMVSKMISEEGKYSISKQMSSITVKDTPANLDRIERRIKEINSQLTQQIMMQMKIVEISSDDSGEYGIDWEAVFENSGNISGAFTTGILDTSSLSFSALDGGMSGTTAMINAINKQSDNAVVTTRNVYTTNGRPVPFQVADQIDYIKNVSSDVSDSTTSYTAETGSIVSGITLNLLPKIISDGKVAVEMVADMTQNNSIESVTFGGSDSQQIIQLPNNSIRNFLQRVTINNGDSMIVTAFERKENSKDNAKVAGGEGAFSWLLGGKKNASKKKVMTIILLTPYIMKD